MRRIIIIVVVLAVIGGGAYYTYTRLTAVKASATANLQTTTVTTGDLVASVAASGSLASPQTGAVTWQAPGTVGKVLVKVGDQVKAGQVLMEMDPTDLDVSFVQAQATLLSDQTALGTLQAGPTQQQIQQAQLTIINDTQAITTAQRALRNALNPVGQSLLDSVNNAQVALDTAQANAQLATVSSSVQQYTNGYWKTDFYWKVYQNLEAKYQAAPNPDSLAKAQSAYNDWKVLADQQSQAQLTSQSDQENKNAAVTTAQEALNTAQANLNYAKAGPDAATVALDQQTLASAQATLAQDQTNLTTLRASPTITDVTNAKAKIAVDQAVLAKTALVATFDGTVTEIDTNPGAPVTSGTQAVVLADLSKLQVAMNVSEVDINSVKQGQEVDMTLDAVSGKTIIGQVAQVGYLGVTTQGVVNYPVTVVITNPDPGLKPGMTASASIITTRHANVLLVPNRAIRAQGGQRVVSVLFEGQQIPVTVTVGLSNDTQTEITGGQLKEGDTIVLNTTTASTAAGGGGFGGGGFGGGFGRGG
jgi:RND family efflux transporter MFP subunit